MKAVKNTRRAKVRVTFDGRIVKEFRGTQARERFENEVLVLRYLEKRACPFVPRVLKVDEEKLILTTTSCGSKVEHLSKEKMEGLFAELEEYGVRHEDIAQRNVTYRQADGRFCLIDFEFATLLEEPGHVSPKPFPDENEA
ncbi:MAG: serine/threonine protein phosphatase [Chthoniobacterales bacterium]